MKAVLRIYDYLESHKRIRLFILVVVTTLLAILASRLSFKEDISDFLPLDTKQRENMEIFQNISGASEIVVLFDNPGNTERVIGTIECFRQALDSIDGDGWTDDAMWTVDADAIDEVRSFVYENIPYFLTSADYARIDSLLSDDGFVGKALERDMQLLMLPSGGFMQDNMASDPLGLFTPVLGRLQGMRRESSFELVDGYVFTPDMSRAVVTIHSPFGNSETGSNSQLLDKIRDALSVAANRYPDVKADITGGPVIAVENAMQIRKDSILAFGLASVLILLIMFYAFRSVANILLTGITILWGFLFALAGMSLIHAEVSLIVVGISSIIMGIAFNYPLHLINHLSHQPDMRLAMKDIVSPLLTGNVTTIGAFMALVPLQSVALRDLGIFASFMLLGTILFVLVFLPHYIRLDNTHRKTVLLNRIAAMQPDRSRPMVVTIAILTLVLAYFAFHVRFDSDISNINYMTTEQRQDMKYFRSLDATQSQDSTTTVYAVADIDIDAWNRLTGKYHAVLCDRLDSVSAVYGFAPDAFAGFREIVGRKYDTLPLCSSSPVISSVLRENFFVTGGKTVRIEKMTVQDKDVSDIEGRVEGSFDIKSMNDSLASRVTDDFNYIGWVCSAIVFLFLWYSFRNLRLAILAFIPMAVSWIWILGIMALTGIQFNIVNIILATFIFGQGDDYTIFMAEGCRYEHTTGKPVLLSYKTSIILSALIMFAGIGVLVFASHPAMFSLGIVTVVGMASVVLMSFVVTPVLYRLLFKWKR